MSMIIAFFADMPKLTLSLSKFDTQFVLVWVRLSLSEIGIKFVLVWVRLSLSEIGI